ncbi:LON peptidase substrate-binding domain-containing protein [Luteolibacter algae]|uniref:LON peptidase substrate-binding domain-containing protein n=1 Tax=Luteolibacter algae TaxID=454151 RepID=A0ABW5DD54_9BACT
MSLPRKCGVMLLPDCTLFPHGGLPLYVFEERYRRMLEKALEGECVFAIARIKEHGNGGEDEISHIGTAGLVRASRQRADGTSELLLHGVIRVKFLEWLDEEDYPCALIEPLPCEPLDEKQGAAAMKTLRGAVEDGLANLPTDVQAGVLTLLDQADEPGLMSDLVAQQFVHDVDLRQKLLETSSVGDRVAMLCGFFEKIRSSD